MVWKWPIVLRGADRGGPIRRRFGRRWFEIDVQSGPITDPTLCAELAALYREHEHRGPDGKIDLLNPAYLKGGVHMGRDAEWFRRQLAIPTARLITVRRGTRSRELIGFDLLFTGSFESPWPAVASDVLWLFEGGFSAYDPALDDTQPLSRLAYRYLILIQEPWRRLGIAKFIAQISHELLRQEGVPLLVGEVYSAPIANVASMHWHSAMGFSCLGTTANFSGPTLPKRCKLVFSQWAKALEIGVTLARLPVRQGDFRACWRLVKS